MVRIMRRILKSIAIFTIIVFFGSSIFIFFTFFPRSRLLAKTQKKMYYYLRKLTGIKKIEDYGTPLAENVVGMSNHLSYMDILAHPVLLCGKK